MWKERTGLTLDLALDIVDGIRGFDLEGDGLAREGLDEDLHCEDLAQVSQYDSTKKSKENGY